MKQHEQRLAREAVRKDLGGFLTFLRFNNESITEANEAYCQGDESVSYWDDIAVVMFYRTTVKLNAVNERSERLIRGDWEVLSVIESMEAGN